MAFNADLKLGRYEIVSLIGASGMGEVYLVVVQIAGRKQAKSLLHFPSYCKYCFPDLRDQRSYLVNC